MDLRRDFELPREDTVFLDCYGCPWETVVDGSQWLLLNGFGTQHVGYTIASATVAIRVESGYPLAKLDMAYVHPPLARADGRPIAAVQATQVISGMTYQRWSRHYTKENPWQIGVDGIERHVLSIEEWFRREFDKCA